MKISIVIPAYQQGEYLEDCIESVLNQTKAVYEVIVVNDGSKDDTKEIAERYMFKDFPHIESPVKVVNQVNKGLSAARNAGIMNATGDYIMFLDADDKLEEDALEKITGEIIRTNADIIAPSFREFGKSNTEVILQPFNIEDLKSANRLPYFCCFRKSVLLEIGGYSSRMIWGWEDYALWFDIFSRNKFSISIIKDILVNYRVKEKSMIHEANAHAKELWEQIYKDFPNVFK